jgi:hypothetical protein
MLGYSRSQAAKVNPIGLNPRLLHIDMLHRCSVHEAASGELKGGVAGQGRLPAQRLYSDACTKRRCNGKSFKSSKPRRVICRLKVGT